jgi:hypothetical protein
MVMDFASQDILQMPKDNAAVVFNKQTALVHGLRASGYAAAASTASTFTAGATSPYTTDTREIVWNTQTGMLTAATPRFAAAAGFFTALPGQAAGAMTIKTATDFAAITWLSLTADSLAAARRSVLTLSTRVQNTGQVWDGTHTFHNNWGAGPTQMQAVRAELRLRVAADSLHLFPLSVTGATQGIPVAIFPLSADRRAFDVTLDQNESATVWYGLEAFGTGVFATAAAKETIVPKKFSLMQNYPNPFNPSTVITYELPKQADVTLTVYDLLGREVATLVNEEEHAGRHTVMFSADKSRISSGMYFYQLRAGIFSAQRTMLILK